MTEAQIDRLTLTPDRIDGIAQALSEIAALPDPIGETIESSVRPNGLEVAKLRVPLGVVFFIYESRPNVTADAAAICIKSGNAVILRGGKEAAHSSRAIVDVMREAAGKVGVPARRDPTGGDDRSSGRGAFPETAAVSSTWPYRVAEKG